MEKRGTATQRIFEEETSGSHVSGPSLVLVAVEAVSFPFPPNSLFNSSVNGG